LYFLLHLNFKIKSSGMAVKTQSFPRMPEYKTSKTWQM